MQRTLDDIADTVLPIEEFRANIEGVNDGVLHGWAWHPDAPDHPALLRVAIDDAAMPPLTCDGFRADLDRAGIRGGRAAIAWAIPDQFHDGAEHLLRLHAPAAPAWPGYETRFRLTLPAIGPGPRFGAGNLLFASDAMPEGDALAGAAILVPEARAVLDAFRHTPPPAIVIPVHNAAPDLARCLAALHAHGDGAGMILVVDDASTDPAIPRILAAAAARDPRLRLLRNPTNLGYTRSANIGLAATAGTDVVLLNSDTIVTPGWLRRLRAAAHRRPRIGSVTPLSDNAGAFSAPDHTAPNAYPAWYTPAQLGRAVTASTQGWAPAVPTGNGFCLYLRRAMLDDVGGFDETAFPRGYGEENDLCMRGLHRGWEHLVEDRTLVLHARSRSFGTERGPLQEAANQVMDERWPDFRRRIRVFRGSPLLQAARGAIGATLRRLEAAPPDAAPEETKPRLLFVIHTMEDGGTAFTTLDLMRGLSADFVCLVLVHTPAAMRLLRFDPATGGLEAMGAWTLGTPPELFEAEPRDHAALLTALLVREGIALVHVRHLMRHGLGVPGVAAALGLPVILSFHDFHLACPTVNLLDDQGRYCAGDCTPGDGACPTLDPWPVGLPPLKHRMIHAWRQLVGDMLRHPVAFVTTSDSARTLLRRHYPALGAPGGAPFHVIEHGRDFPAQALLAAPPAPGGPIRILVPGHMTSPHKGARAVEALKALDRDDRLELHFLGNTPGHFSRLGTCHGTYRRDELPALVARIEPSVALLPALWPETYSHTLSECWACGVPVIGSGLGAVGDRIRRHGGGWLVEPGDAAAILALVLRLAEDPAAWAEQAGRARIANLRSADAMVRDYRLLYRRALAGAGRVMRVRVVVPEAVPVEAQARWLEPLSHPSLLTRCDVAAVPEAEVASTQEAVDADDVLVVPRLGSPALAAAIGRLRAAGGVVIADHGLPAAAEGVPLGRFATRLVAAAEDPLPALTGLVDERPWLWAGARWQARRGGTPAGGAVGRVVLCFADAAGPKAQAAWAALHAWCAATGRALVPVAAAEDLTGLPGADQALAIPTDLRGHADLAVWLADALPAEAALALSLPGAEGPGAAAWALLGLPVLPGESDPAAALLAAAGCLVLPADPALWPGCLAGLDQRGLPGPATVRDAVLDGMSLRWRAQDLAASLGGGVPAHG